MRAIVYTKYGPPDSLEFREVPKPAPGDSEVLIRVHAAAINPLDSHQMRGHVRLMTGVRGPKQKILGCDVAGRIEQAGRLVKQLRPGDAVFGAAGVSGGGFAEYVCAGENKLARKPAGITFEEAAAVPIAGVTALQGLRDRGRIQPGSRILIDGASGGVGTFAVQLAKSFGAEVTAVCSTRNIEIARSLGADHVIDYTQQDFTRQGQRYDLILGANAYHSIFDYRRALNRNGIYVMAGGGAGLHAVLAPLLLGPLFSLTGGKKVGFFIAKVNPQDLNTLRDLLEAGKVRPVIDRRYRLSEAAEAIRYLEQGHAQGKIVLTVEPEGAGAQAAGGR